MTVVHCSWSPHSRGFDLLHKLAWLIMTELDLEGRPPSLISSAHT